MASGSTPHLARRLTRLANQSVRTGLLPVGDAAALAAVGFDPVSEVIGAVANSVTAGGFYAPSPPLYSAGGAGAADATWSGPPGQRYLTMPTYTSTNAPVSVGVPPTLRALKAGYREALNRLVAEARASGADGVVGVRLTRTVTHTAGLQLWNFLAVGTAIRSRGRTHADQPFTTDFSGAQTAAAVRAGWVPVSWLIVPCMAVKWIDLRSRAQQRRLAENGEVDALTDLINTVRHQARQDFTAAARAVRADAAVMSAMTLTHDSEEPEPVSTATVTISGTALARVDQRAVPPASLTIMPLAPRRAGDR